MIAPIMSPTYTMKVSQITFTSRPNPDLKVLWDRGKLPSVTKGFYGDTLTFENVSREHLKPASQGGTKRFGNIVLASKPANNARGNADISLFANIQTVKEYLAQFKDVHLKELNGKDYIRAVKQTLKDLGLKI